jgi:hypothetical protein
VKDAPKYDDHIMVDGQPVPIGKEGRVDLGDLGKQSDDL